MSPGAATSTADVEAGLCFGLQAQGVQVWRYRLDLMIDPARRWLFSSWRVLRKVDAATVKPAEQDVLLQAGLGALHMALRRQVDAVVIVSATLFHPEIIVLMKRAGLKVFLLFTESPYEQAHELTLAGLVDGCWTTERTAVAAFRGVQACSGYLPHGWHPERHKPGLQAGDEALPAHDVVFVGTGFKERLAWFDSINWEGIDLGLYGNWEMLPSRHRLRFYVNGKQVNNRAAAALYRRAKVGLNLYRETPIGLPAAESLNPRAYELAACGVCAVSPQRAEGVEVFGTWVPAPTEAVLRDLLRDAERRATIAAALPQVVAGASWVERAKIVLGDLQFHRAAA